MSINKRYKRDLRQHLSFYICTIFVTLAVVMLYIMMSGAASGEENYVKALFKDNHLEDAQFTTYLEIGKESRESLEEDYDLTLEKQSYCDVNLKDDKTLRIFAPTKKINLYTVTEGKDVRNKDEILLAKSYATTNGVEIGDKMKVAGKTYRVTGFAVRPDYMYPVESQSDTDPNFEEFGIAIVTQEAFDLLDEDDVTSYYSVIYGKDSDQNAFRKELYDSFLTSGYLRADGNLRISSMEDNIETFRITNSTIFPVMLVIIIFLIAIVISMKVRREQKLIGILYANGYQRSQLARHYSLCGILIGLLGSILGIAAGLATVQVVGPMMFMKFEPVPADYKVSAVEYAMLLIVPALAFYAGAYLISLRILRKDAIDMINQTSKKEKHSLRLENKTWSFRTKFRLRAIIANPARSLALLMGLAVSGLFLVYSLCMMDSLDAYAKDAVSGIGDFKYEYILSDLKEGTPDEGVPILSTGYEEKETSNGVTVMGMANNDLIRCQLESGKTANLSGKDCYISRMGSKIFGVGKGDTLVLINPVTLEETKIEVAGILDNDVQNVIYTSREEAAKMMDLEEDAYNMVAADHKLDYKGKDLLQTISRDGFRRQAEKANDDMKGMLYMMMAFGAVFCILIVYLIVNMFLTESAGAITMFKVLGYRNKEINRIVTGVYHLLLPIGILLGIGVGVGFSKFTAEALVDLYNAYISTALKPTSVALYVGLVVVSYLLSLLFLRRKIENVDVLDQLKDNRE